MRQHSLLPGQEVPDVLLPDARPDLLYCFVFPERLQHLVSCWHFSDGPAPVQYIVRPQSLIKPFGSYTERGVFFWMAPPSHLSFLLLRGCELSD